MLIGSRPMPRLRPATGAALLNKLRMAADVTPSAAVRTHDTFNLVTIPVLIGLTGAALLAQHSIRVQQRLVWWFGLYNVIDTVWLCYQPDAVPSSAPLLCAHHLATLGLLLYGVTWTPHLRYVAWMSVVEVNTFFAVLKRTLAAPWVELAFKATWLAIRVIWFSWLPIYTAFLMPEPYPLGVRGHLSRVLLLGAVSGFALLQLYWTREGLRSAPSADE